MNISILSHNTFTANNFRYQTINVLVDSKEAQITLSPNDVNVIVKNAMHNAWKGFGKFFPTIDLAIVNYKDKKIIAAIKTAKTEFGII